MLITLLHILFNVRLENLTERKHQYSASVCVKSDFPIVLKINYMVQSCMLFLMLYGKLGNKLTNVKIVRIKKLLIAFVN